MLQPSSKHNRQHAAADSLMPAQRGQHRLAVVHSTGSRHKQMQVLDARIAAMKEQLRCLQLRLQGPKDDAWQQASPLARQHGAGWLVRASMPDKGLAVSALDSSSAWLPGRWRHPVSCLTSPVAQARSQFKAVHAEREAAKTVLAAMMQQAA